MEVNTKVETELLLSAGTLFRILIQTKNRRIKCLFALLCEFLVLQQQFLYDGMTTRDSQVKC